MNSRKFIEYKKSSKDVFKNLLEEFEQIEKITRNGAYYFDKKEGFGGKPINEDSINEWKKYKKEVERLKAKLNLYNQGKDEEKNKIIDRCSDILFDVDTLIANIEAAGYNLDSDEKNKEDEKNR